MRKLSLVAILCSSLFMVACAEKPNNQDNTTNSGVEQVTKPDNGVENNLSNINIYVQNEDFTKLVSKEIEVNTNDLTKILDELVRSDNSPIPEGTKFLGVEVKDKIAYVNVSKEFISPNSMSSHASTIKVKAIVDTLCLNKSLGIDGVKFLVEGKEEVVDLTGSKEVYKATI